MKYDTTFVRMRSDDHFENARLSKRAPRSVEFNFFINCDKQKRFRRMKDEGQIYKRLRLFFFLILPLDLVKIFQSLVIILPRFSTLKDHN